VHDNGFFFLIDLRPPASTAPKVQQKYSMDRSWIDKGAVLNVARDVAKEHFGSNLTVTEDKWAHQPEAAPGISVSFSWLSSLRVVLSSSNVAHEVISYYRCDLSSLSFVFSSRTLLTVGQDLLGALEQERDLHWLLLL
jgi:hypothetical protein